MKYMKCSECERIYVKSLLSEDADMCPLIYCSGTLNGIDEHEDW